MKWKLYESIQSLLARLGIWFSATRREIALGLKSKRHSPALVDKAIWRPFAFPDKWHNLYLEAQELTHGHRTDNISRQCRFYSTFQLAEHTASLPVGDVIECGCWHGHSTLAISRLLREHDFTGSFHVFDSFEGGLSAFRPEDDESFYHLSDTEKDRLRASFSSSEDFVRSLTEGFGFVQLHKGWIPDCFADFKVGPVRFVHIDVDMFEPTKAALEFFWPHLVPGGFIVVDDYYHSIFEGATKAVDSFLTGIDASFVYRPPFGSIVIQK